MIIRNKKDILNPNYNIHEHPDNMELENWLSWLHIAKYEVIRDIGELELELDKLKYDLELLRKKIFLSLDSKDYPTIKAKKMVAEGRDDVSELKKDIFKKKCELEALNKRKNRYIGRDCIVNKMASVRADTSISEEIEWNVRQSRRR
jgi:hypothetical protein